MNVHPFLLDVLMNRDQLARDKNSTFSSEVAAASRVSEPASDQRRERGEGSAARERAMHHHPAWVQGTGIRRYSHTRVTRRGSQVLPQMSVALLVGLNLIPDIHGYYLVAILRALS